MVVFSREEQSDNKAVKIYKCERKHTKHIGIQHEVWKNEIIKSF